MAFIGITSPTIWGSILTSKAPAEQTATSPEERQRPQQRSMKAAQDWWLLWSIMFLS